MLRIAVPEGELFSAETQVDARNNYGKLKSAFNRVRACQAKSVFLFKNLRMSAFFSSNA